MIKQDVKIDVSSVIKRLERQIKRGEARELIRKCDYEAGMIHARESTLDDLLQLIIEEQERIEVQKNE